MENSDSFRKYAHQFVDWMADYLQEIEKMPVKSTALPGEIIKKIPQLPPEESESMDKIFADFKQDIIPGMTHWQNPNFFAYFPANSSYPSVLAEMLTATMGAQCMVWDTSPAAAELEEVVMEWLKEMTGLPENFHGVIQDTASTATLSALLSAREKYTDYAINQKGFDAADYRVYCSTETHSSIEKGVKIAGFGSNNLVKINIDEFFRMDPLALEIEIKKDLKANRKPICIVATLGTTGSTAIDPLWEIAEIAHKYNIWLHVDAAFAGTALLLEEYRWMIKGIELADSFVFNPHKWMFTNFDCSAYFVKDKNALINTFSITPEYLKTQSAGKVNDYRDWGIPLGRRFRALKLWFVIRSFGRKGLIGKIKQHIRFAKDFENWVIQDPEFELLTPRTLNLVCFRFKPDSFKGDNDALNKINEQFLQDLNATGKVYLTHTKLHENYSLRIVTAQTYLKNEHVVKAWDLIKRTAQNLKV